MAKIYLAMASWIVDGSALVCQRDETQDILPLTYCYRKMIISPSLLDNSSHIRSLCYSSQLRKDNSASLNVSHQPGVRIHQTED